MTLLHLIPYNQFFINNRKAQLQQFKLHKSNQLEFLENQIRSLGCDADLLDSARELIFTNAREDIITTRHKLYKLNLQIDVLMKQIYDAECFLNTLKSSPSLLVENLKKNIHKAFTHYEDTHLLGFSPQVRVSLISIRYGLDELINYDEGFTSEAWRVHYLRLCGFLCDMYSKVRKENKDPEFQELLAELIESTHVDPNKDLLADLETGKSAWQWFGESCARSEYLSIEPKELTLKEEKIFQKELSLATYRALSQPTSLQKHAINAIKLIEAEVKMKREKKQKMIDYYFYARAVRVLNEVSFHPKEVRTAKRLADIAECASGHPSVGKKVAGGLIIALGALLVGTSVAILVLTGGFGFSLSVWGVMLGVNVLKAGVILGVAVSSSALTGIGSFFAGPQMIKSGMRQGLSQEIVDVKKELEKKGKKIPPCSHGFEDFELPLIDTPAFN